MDNNMKIIVATIVTLYFMLMVSANCAEPEMLLTDIFSSEDKDRPFESPNELRSHLNNLSHFYAVVGRPRFGKRTQSRDSVYVKTLQDYLLQKYRDRLPVLTNSENSDYAY
ncbi:pro-neuropeptide Y-like [Planococcus citri]|uniref:pro-neuropeptide Y-like n=1 Tax=Planococcus citri TaxID=170843 RepID=UPI0031F7421B